MKKIIAMTAAIAILVITLTGCGSSNPLKGTTWYIDRMPGTIAFDDDTFVITNDQNGVSKNGEYVLYTGDEAAQITEVEESKAREELQNYEDEYVVLAITVDGKSGKAIGFMSKDSALVVVDGVMALRAEKL